MTGIKGPRPKTTEHRTFLWQINDPHMTGILNTEELQKQTTFQT